MTPSPKAPALSSCCKEIIASGGDPYEGAEYRVCSKCLKPCDHPAPRLSREEQIVADSMYHADRIAKNIGLSSEERGEMAVFWAHEDVLNGGTSDASRLLDALDLAEKENERLRTTLKELPEKLRAALSGHKGEAYRVATQLIDPAL